MPASFSVRQLRDAAVVLNIPIEVLSERLAATTGPQGDPPAVDSTAIDIPLICPITSPQTSTVLSRTRTVPDNIITAEALLPNHAAMKARSALTLPEIERQPGRLQEDDHLRDLLSSSGAHDNVLIQEGESIRPIPDRARAVYDYFYNEYQTNDTETGFFAGQNGVLLLEPLQTSQNQLQDNFFLNMPNLTYSTFPKDIHGGMTSSEVSSNELGTEQSWMLEGQPGVSTANGICLASAIQHVDHLASAPSSSHEESLDEFDLPALENFSSDYHTENPMNWNNGELQDVNNLFCYSNLVTAETQGMNKHSNVSTDPTLSIDHCTSLGSRQVVTLSVEDRDTSPSSKFSGDPSVVTLTPLNDNDVIAVSALSHSLTKAARDALYNAMQGRQGPCSKVWTIPPKRRHYNRATKKQRQDSLRKSNVQRYRQAFKDQERREQTALTRQHKACVRCRMQRIRCEPNPLDRNGECLKCLNLSRPTLSGLPCMRRIITNASLYREQDAPFQLFSQRWQSMDLVDISGWASDEIRTIELTQVFLHAPYRVEVREFTPTEGDMLEEQWSDGSIVRTHSIPPYALADMKKTAQSMKSFLYNSIADYLNGGLRGSDFLIRETYTTAFNYSKKAPTSEERVLLEYCLRLWVGCRKTSNPERICGDDKLGIDTVEDPASPWFAGLPLPPIIIAQMECITYTEILRPLSKFVLHQLQILIRANKKTYWLTIYLTNFILLHSCSMLTRRDWEYARQISLLTEFANPSSIEEHHVGAVNLLTHFHYANKGSLPFELALSPAGIQELTETLGLKSDQIEFITRTALLVQEREAEMRGSGIHGNSGTTFSGSHSFMRRSGNLDSLYR